MMIEHRLELTQTDHEGLTRKHYEVKLETKKLTRSQANWFYQKLVGLIEEAERKDAGDF